MPGKKNSGGRKDPLDPEEVLPVVLDLLSPSGEDGLVEYMKWGVHKRVDQAELSQILVDAFTPEKQVEKFTNAVLLELQIKGLVNIGPGISSNYRVSDAERKHLESFEPRLFTADYWHDALQDADKTKFQIDTSCDRKVFSIYITQA